MIRVENIAKSYQHTEVLTNVTLKVDTGSIYGLLGSNGAGKTTLLKIIAGILKQEQGKLEIDGEHIFENTNLKEKVIFIPDSPYFFSQYTVKQMAEFYASVYPNWSEERFKSLQQLLGLELGKKVQQFSKGMKRQVAFWLALSAMPDYLILDEPFDGLDPVIRKKIKNLIIQDVADREMTVMISSHNLREVEDICDHVGILHQGSFLLEKELDELKVDIHKIQIAFKEGVPPELFTDFTVLHTEKRGSVMLIIVKGDRKQLDRVIIHAQPVVYDILALTLEEIFVYEMEGVGYAIENILV